MTYVGSSIEFSGGANMRPNLGGNLKEKKFHFKDSFCRLALDGTNGTWAMTVPGTADTIAIEEVLNGGVLVTTGSADDDSCMMSTPIIFSGTKKATFEAKITIDDVSGTAVFLGFSDAKLEANNSIAAHYAADTLTTVATDAAGFVIDADSASLGASSLVAVGVKNNVDATHKDTGIDWTDGATKTLRVELDGTTAKFFVDNAQKAVVTSAVTTGTLLCATLQCMTRAGDGSNTVHIQDVDIWMDK
jgi:hypothetical protein